MKLVMKFACVSTKSLNFEIILFSLVPVGNYFSVLFQAIVYVFSFTKM